MAKDKALTLLQFALALDPEGTSEVLSSLGPQTCQGWNCDLKHHCDLYLTWEDNSNSCGDPDMDGQPQLDHPVGNIPEDCKYYKDAYPEDLEEDEE